MKKALLCLFFFPLMLMGVKVDVSVNKYSIPTNDQLTLNLKISDSSRLNVSEPAAPVVNLFSFRNMTSSSASSMSVVNGSSVSEFSRQYSYVYLPQKVGKTQVPSFMVKVNGKDYRTKPINITVVQGTASTPQKNSLSPSTPSFDPYGMGLPDYWEGGGLDSGNTMLLAEPETQNVYQGFPAVVSYYLYSDEMVRSFNLEEENDFEGYGKSTFEQPTMLNYEEARYNGKAYKRALIKRLAIIPNTTGRLQAPVLKGIARLYSVGYLNKTLASTGGQIVVRPLPHENMPGGYNGAVGNFKVSHSISKKDLALGETITISLKLLGRGNFNRFSAPVFASGSGFQVSNPIVMDNLKAGIEGSRSYYYTLIPQSKGKLSLPELKFVWFDNASATYKTYTLPQTVIDVKAANVLSYFNRFLEPATPNSMNPKLSRSVYSVYTPYTSQFWYWLLVFAALGVATYIIIRARDAKLQHEFPELYARKQSAKILHKYLRQATEAAQKLSPDFYPLSEKALFDFLATRYKLANHLSVEEKIAALQEQRIDPELIEHVQRFLQRCQQARYMPEADRAINLQEDLHLLKQIIQGFERYNRTHFGV